MRSSGSRSRSYRLSPTFTRNGRNARSAWIITSKLSGTTTPCRMPYCARRCGYELRHAPSRYCIAASESRPHMRSSAHRKHTTVREHMPSSHRRYADWTPERITRQAGEIGRNTAILVEIIMRERAHPEQGFRACVGIIRLVKSYGRDRLEAACGRALEIGARSFTSVNSILKNNLEAKRPAPAADGPPIAHSNIRGSRYFH